MNKQYVFVINNEIVSTPAILPDNYKNISNFFALSDEQVSDLSWSGNEGGFWLVVGDPMPSVSSKQKIIVEYSLNLESKTCNQLFSVVDLSPEEEEVRVNRIISNAKIIRDRYLVLTDFTQLPDAPITEEAKNDFLIFRRSLRSMFDVQDLNYLQWPTIPTSAPNISIPPFNPIEK